MILNFIFIIRNVDVKNVTNSSCNGSGNFRNEKKYLKKREKFYFLVKFV